MDESAVQPSVMTMAQAHRWIRSDLSRRDFLRKLSALGITAVALPGIAALEAACGATSVGGGVTIKAGGTLKAALTGNPDKLDPATASIYTSGQIYGNIFNKLLEIDSDGSYYGVLAKKWTSPDPKTYIFDLQENVVFHNGEKFSGDDVKYTFERIRNPKTASSFAPLFSVVDTVEVVNPNRVVFHLRDSFGPFLNNIATSSYVVNQKAIESSDPTRNPVGTGPFKFVEWVQSDHITLQKFDKYFKPGRPYLDKIIFYFRNVDESRIQALRSGDLDWLDAIPLQQVTTLKSDPAFNYVGAANAGIPDYIAFNCKQAPFNNKTLRQAVSWAIDRKAIRDVAYFGTGELGVEEVPSQSIFYDGEDRFASAPDVNKAKSLLAQAGHPNGLDIEYTGLPQYPELLKTGEVIQQNLKAVGINMKVTELEVGVWFDRYLKGNYDLTSAYFAGTVDPDTFYSQILHTGGGFDFVFYSNPQLDPVIDRARAETDQSKRKQLYKQIRQVVADDVPLTFVHYETLNYLMSKKVAGSTINPDLQLRLENVGLTG
ncbi:MAG TPA: ABC transporter substrate-binding protein [Candidatus Dormibacteraeota bacterium]|nr:ABC transporter substrate-binding protein [Candidatus Dormibacteraeota bacterium]